MRLETFDGDVTLYEDSCSLVVKNQVVSLISNLLKNNIFVGIVTTDGYDGATIYEKKIGQVSKNYQANGVFNFRTKK